MNARRMLPTLTVGVVVAFASACGGTSRTDPVQQPVLQYSCLNGIQPPAKLIVPATGGVSGRWIVILNEDVTALHSAASAFAEKYGGLILYEWESINGFAISVDDSKAPALSEEPTVCFVEQDQIVSVN